MIQINPLQSYIDGGARAAITNPPSASLVFDLPGKAIWVKGVKLKGTDHTYTFSHDNYISITNTPDQNNQESEDIQIGINTTLLKQAIDTTYGIVNATTNGLAPMFSSANKASASAATTYSFLGISGTTLKWYQLPWRNVRINTDNTDVLGITDTDPLIIGSGDGISVTWDSTDKRIIITNSKPHVADNTDFQVSQYVTTTSNDYRVLLKRNANDDDETGTVRYASTLLYNPSTKILKVNGSQVVTFANTYVGATSSANATAGLVPAATSAQRNYFLRGDGTWQTIVQENTWRPIKVGNTDALGSGTDTGTLTFVAGTGIQLGWDATNKKITITNSAPDQNHNTDYTTINKGTAGSTAEVTQVKALSSAGVIFEGGTNKFKVGDGTNYFEIPIGTSAESHTHTLSIAGDSGTSSIALAASTKYKLTAGGSTYVFTSTPDENVKQTPKTDNVNRPLMMINGGTSAGEQTSTSMFSTGIYANANNNMITANGFIKNGSDSSHVLLGDGGHKALSDFAMASSYVKKIGDTMTGELNFQNAYNINWNDGSWWQRINITDDSSNNTPVFTFQQSEGTSGSSWKTLLTIYDNGNLVVPAQLQANSADFSDNSGYTKIFPGYIQIRKNNPANPTANYASIEFSYDGGTSHQEVYLGYTPNDSYRTSKGLKVWGSSDDSSNCWFEVQGGIYSGQGFNYVGLSNPNNYVLLAGGSYKSLNDFSMAHSHPYLPLYGQSGVNANTIYDSGLYEVYGGSNTPADYGVLLHLAYRKHSGNTTSDYSSQIFLPAGNSGEGIKDSLYYRTSEGSYHSWQRVITDNDTYKFIKKDTNRSLSWNSYYIGTDGTNAATSATSNDSGWKYMRLSVEKGDKFLVKGRGGYTPRLWAFTDTSNTITQRANEAQAWEGSYHEITAGQDGYLIFNVNLSYAYDIIPISWVSGFLTRANISPALLISGNTIATKVGGVTSSYITVPYAQMIPNNITVSTGSSGTGVDSGIWFNNSRRLVLFGTGTSGNTGIYINGIGWIVGADSSGNVYLNGNATSASYASYSTYAYRLAQSSISSLSSFTHSTDFIYTARGGGNGLSDKPSRVDAFGVFSYKTADGWYGQLLTSSDIAPGLYWRVGTSLSGGWRRVLDSASHDIYADGYMPKIGPFITTGYYYIPAVGSTITNISGASDWRKGRIPVKSGDTFYIKGRGGYDPDLYAFTDMDGVVKSISGDAITWEGSYHEITAGQDGYLYFNFNNGYSYGIISKNWLPYYLHEANTYVSGGRGYINGTQITQVTNADNAYTVSSWALVSGPPDRYIWVSHSDLLGHAGYHPNLMFDPVNSILKTLKLYTSDYVQAGTYVYASTYIQAAQNLIAGDGYGLLWNSGSWWQRLINNDTSDTSQWIFKFQQSEGTSGSSWVDYFTIYKTEAYIGSNKIVHAGNYNDYINHLYPKSSWTKKAGYWYTPAVGGKHSSYNSDSSWISYKYRVKSGDSFLIKGRGGYSPDLYAFTDTNEVVKSISGDGIAWEGAYHTITAGQDGYLYVNFNTGYSYGLIPISWTPWYLTEGNYTDYTVTKTGGGASGTWGINVTGSAYTLSSWAQSGGSEDRYVWHSHSDNSSKAAYNSGIMFNPNAGTLKVTSISSTGTWYIGNSSGDYVNIGPGYINIRKYSPVNPTANQGTISFDYYGGQTVYIAYTPNDGYRASKGIKIFGDSSDNGNCWLEVQNNIYATHFYESSDIRLKHDISSISQSIRKFRFNNDNKLYYGFIAQELETLHPELVDSSGEYKTVNYNSAICYYIAELENRVQQLEEKIKRLEVNKN